MNRISIFTLEKVESNSNDLYTRVRDDELYYRAKFEK